MSRNLQALKDLAVKLTPCNTANVVVGETIDEVIEYIKNNSNIGTNKLCLEDSDGAYYDITVSTSGTLVVTPRVKVATPVCSPASGSFDGTQEVTITCATADATIYYTTDGTSPNKASSVYSAPITLSATTTIKAFADKEDCTDSDLATAEYTKTGGATNLLTSAPVSVAEGTAYVTTQALGYALGLVGGSTYELKYTFNGTQYTIDKVAGTAVDIGYSQCAMLGSFGETGIIGLPDGTKSSTDVGFAGAISICDKLIVNNDMSFAESENNSFIYVGAAGQSDLSPAIQIDSITLKNA